MSYRAAEDLEENLDCLNFPMVNIIRKNGNCVQWHLFLLTTKCRSGFWLVSWMPDAGLGSDSGIMSHVWVATVALL